MICGQKTNLPSCVAHRVALQICCGRNWLPQDKLSMFGSSCKGRDFWSEWFICLFDVNSSSVKKYKHMGKLDKI